MSSTENDNNLGKCTNCGKIMNTNTDVCPHCGVYEPFELPPDVAWHLKIGLALGIAFSVIFAIMFAYLQLTWSYNERRRF